MESAIEQQAKTALEVSPEQRKELLTDLQAEWRKQYFKGELSVAGIFLTPKLKLETVTAPKTICNHEKCECSAHVLERATQPSWVVVVFNKKHPTGEGKSQDSSVIDILAEGLPNQLCALALWPVVLRCGGSGVCHLRFVER
jgi:hypothetical protein